MDIETSPQDTLELDRGQVPPESRPPYLSNSAHFAMRSFLSIAPIMGWLLYATASGASSETAKKNSIVPGGYLVEFEETDVRQDTLYPHLLIRLMV